MEVGGLCLLRSGSSDAGSSDVLLRCRRQQVLDSSTAVLQAGSVMLAAAAGLLRAAVAVKMHAVRVGLVQCKGRLSGHCS